MSTITKLDPNKIMQARIAKQLGIMQYGLIINRVAKYNVSLDADFQRLFNGYYRVRKNQKWRKAYYKLFEEMKKQHATFAMIIEALFENTGNIEASFASKMLSTLDTGKPIWDQHVLNCLRLKLRSGSKRETLSNAISLYADIEKWYADYLATENSRQCIAVFNRTFPEYQWISDVKKIDFFLWSSH